MIALFTLPRDYSSHEYSSDNDWEEFQEPSVGFNGWWKDIVHEGVWRPTGPRENGDNHKQHWRDENPS